MSEKRNEYFDPKTHKYPFPEFTDQHYLVVKKDDGTVFDASYPYIDRSKTFLFKRKMVRFLLHLIVFPVLYVKLGLRIQGKENLKKHKKELAGGAVMMSNHVHLWDYLAILCAVKRPDVAVVVWKKNVSGENGPLIRSVGGIPIPEGDFKATKAFMNTVDGFLSEGGLLQVYGEGSMWEYYAPIRPFKFGAANFAIRNGKPILPMAFSYRKPSWIRRLFKQPGAFTLSIGEPLYANPELESTEAQAELLTRVHDSVCRLAGIDPEKNIYPPLFHQNHKVNYY